MLPAPPIPAPKIDPDATASGLLFGFVITTAVEATKMAIAAKKRETILALAKDLKAKEPEKRIKALKQLEAYGTEANIVGEQIIEAMADKVPAVQSAASDTLEKVCPKVHPHVFTILFGMDKSEAVRQLERLGADAEVAVPLLLYLHKDFFYNTTPIGGVGPGGPGVAGPGGSFPGYDLLYTVAKIAPKDKRFAAAVLTDIATPVPSAPGASAPVPSLNHYNKQCGRRQEALAQLQVIEADNADKVKALLEALKDGAAILEVMKALEGMGKDAAPALPTLKVLKKSPNDAIRMAATQAVSKIE